jgi:hypothetical protein
MWGIVLYLLVGILCAFHWFEEDYGKEYKQAKANGEAEDGMAVLLLLALTIFWPLVFGYKFYKAYIEP